MPIAAIAKQHDELLLQSSCNHSYNYYKQTVVPDNPLFPANWSAYNVIKGCPKCHKKINVAYKVVRG